MRQVSILIMGVLLTAGVELSMCRRSSSQNYLEGGDSDFEGEDVAELDEGYMAFKKLPMTRKCPRELAKDRKMGKCRRPNSCAGGNNICGCNKRGQCRTFPSNCHLSWLNDCHNKNYRKVKRGSCYGASPRQEQNTTIDDDECSRGIVCIEDSGFICSCDNLGCIMFECRRKNYQWRHNGECTNDEWGEVSD